MKHKKVFLIPFGFCLVLIAVLRLIPAEYLRGVPVWVLAAIIIAGTVFTLGFSIYAFAKFARRGHEQRVD